MSCVACHVSHVTCNVSHVMCHMSHVIFFLKKKKRNPVFLIKLIVEGPLSTGPIPSSFFNKQSNGLLLPSQFKTRPLANPSSYAGKENSLEEMREEEMRGDEESGPPYL